MQEISKGNYTPQELQKINQVRWYLQVVTLADISVLDRTKLKKDSINGIKHSSCSSDFYSWPRIPKPPLSYLKLWRSAIINYFTSSRMKIKDYLQSNQWTSITRNLHSWWYSIDDKRLYRQQNNGLELWTISLSSGRRSRSKEKYQSNGIKLDKLPHDAVPADVYTTGNNTKLTSLPCAQLGGPI